jgi:hypothetical protein
MKRHLRSDGYYGYNEDDFGGDRFSILGLSAPDGERKTKWTHPYNYDPIIVYFGSARKGDSAVYSDRLWQGDYNKCEASINSIRSTDPQQRFRNDDPKQVEQFVSLYYNKQVEVTAIVEGCNASNGYPYWIFYFRVKQ